MFSFLIFDSRAVDPAQFPPRQALLVGADDIPLQGAVGVQPGRVEAQKPPQQSAGVCIQLHVGDIPGDAPTLQVPYLGLLSLQTTLLPDRQDPYFLTIELARHRIMFLLNKMEDWGLFDLPQDTPALQQFEEARQAFTRALVLRREAGDSAPADADRTASRALALAVQAGESLTLIEAERGLKGRLSGATYAEARAHLGRLTPEAPPQGAPVLVPGAGRVVLSEPVQVGVAISPQSFSEPLQRAASLCADFVTVPMRWIDMEPAEGKYNFTATDRWIEWAIRSAKLPVHAGPLVDFRARTTPEWLYIWENDYETLRDLVAEHVQALVTRYRRTVQRWTVAGGLHVNTNFKISFEQIMDLTRLCVLLVRKLHPQAKIQLEVAQPWGEYHAYNRRSIPPYMYAEAVLQAGIPIDALGLRVQMGHAEPGLATRDLMSFSAMLDRYASLEKPIVITGLGAPSGTIPATPFRPRVGADAEGSFEPGNWRGPWTPERQAEWLICAASIAAAKPYVQSICWQELADTPNLAPEMPGGGLLAADGTPRPALGRLAQVRQALREGRSPLALLSR